MSEQVRLILGLCSAIRENDKTRAEGIIDAMQHEARRQEQHRLMLVANLLKARRLLLTDPRFVCMNGDRMGEVMYAVESALTHFGAVPPESLAGEQQ